MKDQEKIVPHNLEAEESVIGSLIIGGDISHIVLESTDFFNDNMALIYQSCLNLHNQGVIIDPVTLADDLQRVGKLKIVGGSVVIMRLMANTPTSLDLPYYSDIVKRYSTFRKLIQVGNRISEMGYNPELNINKAIENADSYILELRKYNNQTIVISPEERFEQQSKRYDDLLKLGKTTSIGTNLIDLDYQLGGGFFPGDLIILGARPGVGKTTLLQQIANHTGKNHKPVLFASGEMTTDSLTDREIAALLKIPITTIRSGDFESDVYVRILECLEFIKTNNVYQFVRSKDNAFTTANLYQAALNIKSRFGLSLIVVDYLSLLKDKYGNNQVERLGYITSELKNMAGELNVPVLCAHQLNRGTETRDDKRPQLFDLRDSGNIEQDADVVIFIYRENYYGTTSNNFTEIILAKQRQGSGVDGGIIKVYFNKKEQLYKNATEVDNG
jgi:replicative DNA helicase